MYSPPNVCGKKFEIQVVVMSPPSFRECRFHSRLNVSAICNRFSSVSRGVMLERPKRSITSVILVRTSSEFGDDSWSSTEYCTRKWLVQRGEIALKRFPPALTVLTSSVPLLLIALKL